MRKTMQLINFFRSNFFTKNSNLKWTLKNNIIQIKFTYENQLNRLLVNSVWINLVSLASVYFSLDSLLKGDMWVLPFYIGGSVLGKWIAMTQMDNLESKLFIFFKTKEDGKRNTRV